MQNKSNFYIFLDIDGVMSDWDFIISEINSGRMKKGQLIRSFKPESVEALNFLIKEISKNYNCKVVISSTWRMNMEETKQVFQKHNILCSNELDKTPRLPDPHERGKEIIQYLEQHKFNQKHDDFLIIDDETFDFDNYFQKNKIIKTEIYHNSLSLDMVKEYLNSNQSHLENDFQM